jgi:hypothetical protein
MIYKLDPKKPLVTSCTIKSSTQSAKLYRLVIECGRPFRCLQDEALCSDECLQLYLKLQLIQQFGFFLFLNWGDSFSGKDVNSRFTRDLSEESPKTLPALPAQALHVPSSGKRTKAFINLQKLTRCLLPRREPASLLELTHSALYLSASAYYWEH